MRFNAVLVMTSEPPCTPAILQLASVFLGLKTINRWHSSAE